MIFNKLLADTRTPNSWMRLMRIYRCPQPFAVDAGPGGAPVHGTQYIGMLYGTHLKEAGILAPTGRVGDSYDNALAETINCAYKTEPVKRSKPFESVHALEQATFQCVS